MLRPGPALLRPQAQAAGLGAVVAVFDRAVPAGAVGVELLRHAGAGHGPRPRQPAAGAPPPDQNQLSDSNGIASLSATSPLLFPPEREVRDRSLNLR